MSVARAWGCPFTHLSWLWRLCGIPFRVGIAQPIGCNLEGERIAIDRSGRIVCAQVPRRRSIGQRPGDGTDHPRPTQLSNEGRRASGDGDGARGFTLEDRPAVYCKVFNVHHGNRGQARNLHGEQGSKSKMAVSIWGYLRLPTRCEGEAKVIPLSDLSSAESMACNESATLHDAIQYHPVHPYYLHDNYAQPRN